MKISWSKEAIHEVEARFGSDVKLWKLVFDSEGCGCSVDGVPTLWAVNAPLPDDVQADSDAFGVWYEKQHEMYFDEPLRISYLPGNRSFKLASDGQTYTNTFKLQDLRH
jgi:uncharacterized protein YqkB